MSITDETIAIPARFEVKPGRFLFGWLHGNWAFLSREGDVYEVRDKDQIKGAV